MNRGVANLMRLAGLSLDDAVRMATVNAARAGKVATHAQDRVEFRVTEGGEIAVERTWLAGRLIHDAQALLP
jgi:N-acetylglucosamine-6-phosphate deacetylase